MKNLKVLKLFKNNLKEFPMPVCALKTLEEVDLSFSNIRTTPSKVKQLKNLKILKLSNNNLDEFPIPACELEALEEVDLDNNNITTIPPQVKQLKNLKVLKLLKNRLREFPKPVCELDSLEEVDMSHNNITTVQPEVKQLKKLKKLRLKDNDLKEFPIAVCELEALEEVGMSDNKITTVPTEVIQLKNLKSLNLQKNKLDQFPISVCQLMTLEEVILSNNKIPTVPWLVKQLKNLKILRLQFNKLNEFPEPICGMDSLEEVNLGNNRISIVPWWVKQLRNLKILRLHCNKLNEFPGPVCGMESLEEVNLSNNQILTIPLEAKQLKNLKELRLRNNNLVNIPLSLCELKTLEEIYLDNNKISAVPPQIEQLKKLRILGLCKNNIDEFPKPVCELETLEVVDLEGNSITTIPPEVRQLKNLKVLKLKNNRLREFPKPVCELDTLEEIDMSHNNITTLRPEVKQLKKLKKLRLNHNHLNEFPVTLCELEPLEEVYLDHNNITTVRPEVKQLKKLKKLRLSHNNLKEFPATLYKLEPLEEVDLDHNNITMVSSEVKNLQNLKILRMCNNGLDKFPVPLCKLETLEEAYLDHNNITTVPSQVKQLKNLRKIWMRSNNLVEFPVTLCELEKIKGVFLDNNKITALPALTTLSRIRSLSLKSNSITKISEEIGKMMQHLESLNLENNKLEKLPEGMRFLSSLNEFCLGGNTLIQPPEEVVKEGREAVFRYLEDLAQTRAEKASRLQVQVLGETCVGKTSLVGTLTTGEPYLTLEADRTHVLQQKSWVPQEDIFLNINDFGGHSVYKVAHNFFLTKNALSLVVFDICLNIPEKYHRDIGTWIENIYYRSPESRILLVGTHADFLSVKEIQTKKENIKGAWKAQLEKRQSRLKAACDTLRKKMRKQKELTEAYRTKLDHIRKSMKNPPQVCEDIFVTSSKSQYGIENLKNELIRIAKQKAIILPGSWLKIVENIEKAKHSGTESVLSMDSIGEINEEHEPPPKVARIAEASTSKERDKSESQRMEDVISFLHDTGVVLWFKANPLLRQVIFHKQDVLINLLKAVLRHDLASILVYDTKPFSERFSGPGFESAKQDALKRGILSTTLLECLWEKYDLGTPGFLAMQKLLKDFEVCYVVKGEEEDMIHFPWILEEGRPKDLSSKWQTTPLPRDALQISTEVHFAGPCPIGLYETAAVHLHEHLKNFKSTRIDWKDGFYAQLGVYLRMTLERECVGNPANGILRLSMRGDNLHQLKESYLKLFKDLTQLIERECPGATRVEYVVCPHCLHNEETSPSLFEIPERFLNVSLEDRACYHPCPEEDPSFMASADFYYPVTEGAMTDLHSTALRIHAVQMYKDISGLSRPLQEIMNRLVKEKILKEQDGRSILEPDGTISLFSILKGKRDSAFYIFCGALHDSGKHETASLLMLSDLAVDLGEDGLKEALTTLLNEGVLTQEEENAVLYKSWRQLSRKVEVLLQKLSDKVGYLRDEAFFNFKKVVYEIERKHRQDKTHPSNLPECDKLELLQKLERDPKYSDPDFEEKEMWTSLNLQRIGTRIPQSISRCASIERLDISGNGILDKATWETIYTLRALKDLKASECGVNAVSLKIGHLANLKKLDLSKNHLNEFPLSIFTLERLIELDLSHSNITTIPPEVQQLKNLKKLNMSHNSLKEIQARVCKLETLEELHLSHNKIATVPPEIEQLRSLKEINLSNNELREFPIPLLGLETLESVWMDHNYITNFPVLTTTSRISVLSLNSNNITEVSEKIVDMMNYLVKFDLRNNKLKRLPVQIRLLSSLRELHLIGNKLIQPPQDLANEGKEPVFRYLDDLSKSLEQEASILQVQVLGETCAGKTSLVGTLTTGEPYLTLEADRTHVLQRKTWMPQQDVFLNINDFGGHSVYKVAYIFFLTNESLSLVVFNICLNIAKDYHSAIGTWIDNIYCRSPQSRILLVGTHADLLNDDERQIKKKDIMKACEAHLEGRLSSLNAAYANLNVQLKKRETLTETYHTKMDHIRKSIENPPRVCRNIYDISSESGYGIKDLKEKLIQEAKKKTIILPSSWLKIVNHIEETKHSGTESALFMTSLQEMNEEHESAPQVANIEEVSTSSGIESVLFKTYHKDMNKDQGSSPKDAKLEEVSTSNGKEHALFMTSLQERDKEYEPPPKVARIEEAEDVPTGRFRYPDTESRIMRDVMSFLHETGVVWWFKDEPSLQHVVFHKLDKVINLLKTVLCRNLESILEHYTTPFSEKFTKLGFKSAKQDALKRGILSATLLECFLEEYNQGPEIFSAMLKLLEIFQICYAVRGKDTGEERFHLPWLLEKDRPKVLSPKWQMPLSRDTLQISIEVRFSGPCPTGLYEMAAVHFHGHLGNFKSTRVDWKNGFYAQLGDCLRMTLERECAGNSENGILRLSMQGNNIHQLQESCLNVFMALTQLIERECPGASRDEYLVCPHCMHEEITPPSLFELPDQFLSVPLEDKACYHPCREEELGVMASADFYYPVTNGNITDLHSATLRIHGVQMFKNIRGPFRHLWEILSRLVKEGILTAEERSSIGEPDELFSILKRKRDSAFYIFCGALHDSGYHETASLLRLSDLAADLGEDGLKSVLEILMSECVLTEEEVNSVHHESGGQVSQEVELLLQKLSDKVPHLRDDPFSKFKKAVYKAERKKRSGSRVRLDTEVLYSREHCQQDT
ncbi:uncharacterized protein LOC106170298 [Lingula anatina]|uniref:Uncharacterized protein LOC106170298 n=1 Tax=Lingula anatina TaxID=7574 RepID=A0A1S3J553_LINAN|nr:uncharacterized protein LOC106170298 [Lingula anatina]|eukprot:XP_013405562.1 uncharacterized protein LOC106170298 [Lingula anatina]